MKAHVLLCSSLRALAIGALCALTLSLGEPAIAAAPNE